MLDKNIDWRLLRGDDGSWRRFRDVAETCTRLHRERGLPWYDMRSSEIPPKEIVGEPDKREGGGGYDDPTQTLEIREYHNDTAMAAWVRRVHGLKHCHVKLHVQTPGHVVKNHRDHNTPLLAQLDWHFGTQDVRKVLHFLTDWHLGQVIMMGDTTITGWRAGDAVTFPWYLEHATANANHQHDRHMLFIQGVA